MLLVHFDLHYYYCLNHLNKMVSSVKIPCDCNKVYVGAQENRRSDARKACSYTNLAVSEENNGHAIWNEVKFTDEDSEIEISEAWILTIRKHNSRSTTKRTCEGTASNSRINNDDRNTPIAANQRVTNSQIATRKHSTSSPYED